MLRRTPKLNRLVLILLLLLLVAAVHATGLLRWLDLQTLLSQREALLNLNERHPLLSFLGFALIYVLVTGLSLPGAALLSLVAGAVFGVFFGTLIVSFASVAGACIAFLLARHLLRTWVERRFAGQLAPVHQGIERDGAYYLFTLRMVPAVPFFLVNLLAGLTRLPLATFAWVSQLGMLPATVVYVFAGTQLAAVTSLADVMSPGLLLAFALVGLLPLAARKLLARKKGVRHCDEEV